MSATFEGGGDFVECAVADMKPYDHAKSYYDQTTDCSLTFTTTAAGQTLTSQGFWRGQSVCVPGCGTRSFGTISNRPFTRPVVVEESLVINTRGP